MPVREGGLRGSPSFCGASRRSRPPILRPPAAPREIALSTHKTAEVGLALLRAKPILRVPESSRFSVTRLTAVIGTRSRRLPTGLIPRDCPHYGELALAVGRHNIFCRPESFLTTRFLLGFAEANSFTGMIFFYILVRGLASGPHRVRFHGGGAACGCRRGADVDRKA